MMKFKSRGFALVESAVSLIAVTSIAMSINQQNVYKQEVNTALESAKTAQEAVVSYYKSNGVLPTSNAEANISEINSKQSLKINEFGDIILTFNKNQTKNDELANKTIVLEAKVIDDKITWQCNQGSLENKYRPQECVSIESRVVPAKSVEKDLPDNMIDFVYKANLI